MLSGDNRKRDAYEEEESFLPEHVRMYGLRHAKDVATALSTFRDLIELEERSDLDEQDVDFIEEELEEIGLCLVEFPPMGWYIQLLTCGLCGEQLSRPDIQEGSLTLRYAYCPSHSPEDIKEHERPLLAPQPSKKAARSVIVAMKPRHGRKMAKSERRFLLRRRTYHRHGG